MDSLINVDSGREVPYDGESSGGAVNYFEQLCVSRGQTEIRRNPGIVLNWYDSLSSAFFIYRTSLINFPKVNQ